MRWIKYGILFLIFLFAVYTISMTFVPENKDFTFETEIEYPVEKVFPQFSNLQNFTRWNSFFADTPELQIDYFSPYDGQGSALSYRHKNDKEWRGDLFIRYENPNKTLRYQLFQGKQSKPYLIDVKFRGQKNKTKIAFFIHTPKLPFFSRASNLFVEDEFGTQIDQSMRNLADILSKKVDKERQRESIKFDTLIVENRPAQLLFGVNVSSKNEKKFLFKNIVLNHNKVLNYVKMDLGKKQDEYGEPVLITDADNYKNKEISYFYGVPLSSKTAITDNNFSYRTLNAGKMYTIYYRGEFAGRIKAIQELLSRAKKDTLRSDNLLQTFLEEPGDENHTIIKLSLPVFK